MTTALECEAARCTNSVVALVATGREQAPVCAAHIDWARDLFYGSPSAITTTYLETGPAPFGMLG